jgi:DNA repair protein RecN (Recombination protein N)
VITELSLSSLGVIERAQLELGEGLTVLTGETGAGKTMVISSLQLLLGARASADRIRTGAERAQVTAQFDAVDASVAGRVTDAGGVVDEGGAVTAARVVTSAGRSRAALGGAAVPATLLADVGADLVAIHGQHDQTRLLAPARQRELLDRFGGHEQLAADVAAAHARLRQLTDEQRELQGRRAERFREADALTLGLAEVSQVMPLAGEDRELQAEESRLAHAVELTLAAGQVAAGLADDEHSVLVLLAGLQRSLDAVRGHDRTVDELATRLADLTYLSSDLSSDLHSYADSLEADPGRLETVQQRRAALAALTRKYGPELADVIAWAADAQERVTELAGTDDRLEALEHQVQAAAADWVSAAGALSEARTGAAQRLGGSVTQELRQLAMPDAELVVAVEPRSDRGTGGPVVMLRDGAQVTSSPSGLDEVTFLLRPHTGAPAAPVGRGASGGELSRVMLAIEVVLADADPVPTVVFDEVDAGVGGAAAVEVGRRLARLGASRQVLVVTHLPQVAAFADRHWVVSKSTSGEVVESGVTELDDSGRVKELTRMLAGLSESTSGQAHAEELLQVARDSR